MRVADNNQQLWWVNCQHSLNNTCIYYYWYFYTDDAKLYCRVNEADRRLRFRAMLWLKLNKYRSLFSRKLSELTGRTRLHLRRLQWADWVVFNRLAKSHHILEIIRLEKHAGAKNRIPELQLDLLASLVRWWHTRQTFLVTMQPIDYFLASWTSSGSHHPHIELQQPFSPDKLRQNKSAKLKLDTK